MNLTEEKTQEAINELKEWLGKPTSKEDFSLHGIKKIEDKLNELRIPKSILNGFESLENWYSNNFVFDFLTKAESHNKVEATTTGYYLLILTDIFADQFPNNPPSIAFEKMTYWLANCLSQKWYNESETMVKIINKGLNTQLLEGGFEIKLAAWFIVNITNKSFGINLDYEKYNYPESMDIYQKVIDSWNTKDVNLVDTLISDLCDYHLSQANYGSESQEDTMTIQFSSVKEFVYCYEILAWLSIREKIGLQNPMKLNHTLMQLPLNKLATALMPMPKNELFENVLKKLESVN